MRAGRGTEGLGHTCTPLARTRFAMANASAAELYVTSRPDKDLVRRSMKAPSDSSRSTRCTALADAYTCNHSTSRSDGSSKRSILCSTRAADAAGQPVALRENSTWPVVPIPPRFQSRCGIWLANSRHSHDRARASQSVPRNIVYAPQRSTEYVTAPL